ncbi:polyketide synthase [Paraphaeosphaeria sporulosa]
MLTKENHGPLEPIAVVGLAFKFPGGGNTEKEFWEIMMQRKCVVGEFPPERGNIDTCYDPSMKGTSKVSYSLNGHFLDSDIREFDPKFFSISQAEAGSMDPQHRALMETTYHAFENAGVSLKDIAGSRTSVHVGCFSSDFHAVQCRDPLNIPKYSATGGSSCILSNRISWFFDLHGPSMTIDTACSSSMVAFDLACQGIWNGSVDSAIVGGANLIQAPDLGVMLSNMSMLSPDGRCYSFDQRGNGYARGEGVATLFLKPLSAALENGDPIRALVRAVGMNQDGHTKGGLTQPSMKMQASLVNETYRKAGLSMANTRFFEAHGTATPLGDPIEARAIGECFRLYRSPDDPIYVGAVKSNIGHLEGCSGLAGIIKVVLAIERGVIPPNANFESLNSQIDADFFNLKFPREPVAWPHDEHLGIRRASVNSFGFGGTNAHVILDDVESYLRRSSGLSNGVNGCNVGAVVNGHTIAKPSTPRLLLMSAADEGGCSRLAASLNASLRVPEDKYDEALLDDLAFTLNSRRTKLPWRSFAVCRSPASIEKLGDSISKPVRRDDASVNLAFVFTGQGAQWAGMSRELLGWSVFRKSVLLSQSCLAELQCSWSLIDLLVADGETIPIDNPRYSQLLTTVVELAIVDLFASIAVRPTVVLGHSSGEIAAAYCAGLIDRSSAIRIAYFRGELAARLVEQDPERHSMLSVGLSPSDLQVHLENLTEKQNTPLVESFTISCINSPSNVTVAALQKHLDTLSAYLTEQGVFARQLQVDLGYHSPQMRQMSADYVKMLGNLKAGVRTKDTRMVSSVTGHFLEEEAATSPEYWDKNMVSQVKFSEAASFCFSTPVQELPLKLDQSHLDNLLISGIVEIGPHSTLKAPLRQILDFHKRSNEVFYTSALQRGHPADETFLNACGRLYCENVSFNVGLLTEWCRSSPSAPKVLTQLPKYPFDHSIVYWEETRISREIRMQKHGFNKFLGVSISDGTLLDRRWRLILRTDEQPWIKDHVINGANIYPGAGMCAMAIEAAKQLLHERIPTAFVLENVEFIAPILLNDTAAGTEVEISLTALKSDKALIQYKFRIATWRRDESSEEVCHGTISADYGNVASEVDPHSEREMLSRILDDHERATDSCNRKVEKFYETVKAKCGADFGPSFQRLQDISCNGEGDVRARLLPYEDYCVVHPVVLDATFHISQAISNGDRFRTMVPRRVSKIWISTSGIGHDGIDQEVVHARASMPTRRSAVSSISVLRQTTHEVALKIIGFEYTAVSEDKDSTVAGDEAKHLTGHMIWRPDVDLLGTDELAQYCARHRDTRDDPEEYFRDWEAVSIVLGTRALRVLGDDPPATSELANYVSWLKTTIASVRNSFPKDVIELVDSCILGDGPFEALCERVEKHKAGKLYVAVGRSLGRILTGELNPLAVIFQDEELMQEFYDEMIYESRPLRSMQAFVDLLAHKNPDLKVLEIGGGTGGSTNTILEVLNSWHGPRFGQYVFTDIGPSFLQKARTRFSDLDNMEFRALNIEKDPLEQGFAAHEFDIVVADMVLHATSDLSKTLQNVRKLLKPGGKLILKELTSSSKVYTGFVFGLLPGWWLSVEPWRAQALSPCVDAASWSRLLDANQFSGVDLELCDFESDICHMWSYFICTATDATVQDQKSHGEVSAPIIVAREDSQAQKQLARHIHACMNIPEVWPEALSFDETVARTDLGSRDLIILLESEQPVLVDITPKFFAGLQKVLCSSRSIIWVTRNTSSASPEYGMITGLIRVLRIENRSTQIVALAVDDHEMARTASNIFTVFKATQKALDLRIDVEPEYLDQSNLLHINRIVSSKNINKHIFRRTAQPVVEQPIGNSNLRLGIRALGLLDTLEFSEEMPTESRLGPKELIVRVHSIGVNFKDCMTLLGRLDTDDLGTECAGTVERVGSACGDIVPGSRVAVVAFDAYRTFVRTNTDRVSVIPDWMSFSQAASIPTVFCTAYFSLIKMARLQRNETVLIHAASGGTGQAAIQVAQDVGAKIFATVGSAAKKQLLEEVYGIPGSQIYYSRDTSFADGVLQATGNRGVDVILNSLAGKQLQASWDIIAQFGRFVEIGKTDINARNTLPMYSFGRNASFIGVDVSQIIEAPSSDGSGSRIQEVAGCVMHHMRAGTYKPVYPLHNYDIGSLEQALRFLQSGKSSGKIVVNVAPDSVVPVVQSSHSPYQLRPDATYVIAGGLGGLGRSIANWLCDRGARSLILLSRTGTTNPNVRAEVERLRARGITVECPMCDIADLGALQSALEACSHLPPIRGCFQGAMVLRDATFARMTFDQWTECTLPKVQGSWNLHQAMAGVDLDFFILLSSAGAIVGNGGQSNYAAGNTFQDALARFRVSRGAKAISLNLGMILGGGYVAENDAVRERLVRNGELYPIHLEEFLAMLDYCCNPDLGLLSPDECQLVTGVTLPAQLRAEGKDVPLRLLQPLIRCLAQIPVRVSFKTQNEGTGENLMAAFREAENVNEAASVATEMLKIKTSKLLGLQVQDVEASSQLEHYGVDSLVAIELRNWISKELGVDIAVFEILGGMSLLELGVLIAQRRSAP